MWHCDANRAFRGKTNLPLHASSITWLADFDQVTQLRLSVMYSVSLSPRVYCYLLPWVVKWVKLSRVWPQLVFN